ncbi:MAG: hypothetical protein ACREU6_18540 [Steroidobacteraceae bacterium]
MRLARAGKDAAGKDRTERLRRERAAALVLRAAFPTVEQLCLELKFESTSSSTPAFQSHQLHPPARAFFEFPCPYADCDGHYDLAGAVAAALADPARRSEGMLECPGVRAGERTTKQPCRLQLKYVVTATLRPGA